MPLNRVFQAKAVLGSPLPFLLNYSRPLMSSDLWQTVFLQYGPAPGTTVHWRPLS